ncbi:unnamed protein product [Adineta ricciae]|uniref:Uncharacterized protein n=1 Tax=Adineta ricciae TaxID=249248 RepID=A0A815V4U9_ADIRI|nr:unnamed protein product [Adineta ricciae]
MNKDCVEPTKFGEIYDKSNSSNSDSVCEVLYFDGDNQKRLRCSDQTVPPGVTHSTIEILRSPNKSSLTNLHNEDSSTISLTSSCSNEIKHINSSNLTVEEILKENIQQKKEIEYYKSQLMHKYLGSDAQVASKYTQTDDIIPAKLKKKKCKGKEELKQICRRLNLNMNQVEQCKQSEDIAKTCRSITKCLYPDLDVRSTMTILKMPAEEKFDIRGNFIKDCYKKLLFP